MTGTPSTALKIEKILNDFLKNNYEYAKHRRARDFVAGNPFARKSGKAAAKLRHEFGSAGRDALASAMDDDDLIVRSIAAADCLDIFPEKAERILEEITTHTEDIFESVGAEQVLKLWRAGRKEFPGGPVKPDAPLDGAA
jgi:hypothetical protein